MSDACRPLCAKRSIKSPFPTSRWARRRSILRIDYCPKGRPGSEGGSNDPRSYTRLLIVYLRTARNGKVFRTGIFSGKRTFEQICLQLGKLVWHTSIGAPEAEDDEMKESVVFLVDVDNTLLDNDRVIGDLKKHLADAFGPKRQECYWAIFEELRRELGYADYLGALQQYRIENPLDSGFLLTSSYLLNYPFANRLFPGSLDALDRMNELGMAVILTDGDVVFQPRKMERSGLLEAVSGRALIYIHKEQQLEDVVKHYPADHYVLVDDKLRILTAVKAVWGSRLTTVFPRQGHYAHDVVEVAKYPPADITIDRIGDFLNLGMDQLIGSGRSKG